MEKAQWGKHFGKAVYFFFPILNASPFIVNLRYIETFVLGVCINLHIFFLFRFFHSRTLVHSHHLNLVGLFAAK